jgi:predicted O-linked N-acetylglucosamine transferase (SPINDLY family)
LAVRLARDPQALKAQRDRLAQNRNTCALFDTDRFRKHIEKAYRTMWQTWLAGEKPQGFSVQAEG